MRFFGESLRRRGRVREEEQADRSRSCNRRSRLQRAALFTVAINSGACKLGAPTCEAAAATVAAATAVVAAAFVAVATARRAFVQNISAPWWRNSPGCSPGRRIDYWTNSVIPGDLRSRSFSERSAICTMLVTINRNADQNSFTSDTFVLKIWSKFKWYRKKR